VPAPANTIQSRSPTPPPQSRDQGHDTKAPFSPRAQLRADSQRATHLSSSGRGPLPAVRPVTPPAGTGSEEGKLPADRILIRLETPDPNVVIIWLEGSEGKGK
jgi:hypothetical protein